MGTTLPLSLRMLCACACVHVPDQPLHVCISVCPCMLVPVCMSMCMLTQMHPHGRLLMLAHDPLSSQVVSVGRDGAICITPLDEPSTSTPSTPPGSHTRKPYLEGCATKSYRAVRWSSPDTFVAAGTTGTHMHPCMHILMNM